MYKDKKQKSITDIGYDDCFLGYAFRQLNTNFFAKANSNVKMSEGYSVTLAVARKFLVVQIIPNRTHLLAN